MTPSEVAVYGAGGFAREVAWLIQSCNQTKELYKITCFISNVPEEQNTILNDIPVISLHDCHKFFPSAHVVAALGNPGNRQLVTKKAAEKGFAFQTLVHPDVRMSKWVDVGIGTVICAGNILTTNIKLGNHVQINLHCTVGHDAILGDFTTLAPGVHVSGRVHVGKRVYLGTGAVVINGNPGKPLIIEDDVTVGAGSCVTRSLTKNQTYVGVPARPLKPLKK